MVKFDDDEGELFEAFHALRTHIVRVSSAFGARLGVRLRALSAAEGHDDPSVVEVFGATVVDAIGLMSAPLSPSDDPPPDEGADGDEAKHPNEKDPENE